MSAVDQFRFDGRRAVVVGGATGMGAATARMLADLGAEVVALDVQDIPYEVDHSARVDLRSVASIDAALDEIGGPIDALFACAGIATDGVPLMQVNFIGHRHLIETAIARGLMPAGSAIAAIASIGGLGWTATRSRSATSSRPPISTPRPSGSSPVRSSRTTRSRSRR